MLTSWYIIGMMRLILIRLTIVVPIRVFITIVIFVFSEHIVST